MDDGGNKQNITWCQVPDPNRYTYRGRPYIHTWYMYEVSSRVCTSQKVRAGTSKSRNIYSYIGYKLLRPDSWLKSWKTKFGGVVLHDHTKNVTLAFWGDFFFLVKEVHFNVFSTVFIFWPLWTKITAGRKKKRKRPASCCFVWSWRTPLPKLDSKSSPIRARKLFPWK